MTVTTVAADELDEVLDLIAAEQAHPDRGTTVLGEEREGIAAELGDVEPDWTATPGLSRIEAFLETKTVWHPKGR